MLYGINEMNITDNVESVINKLNKKEYKII